MSPNSMRTLFSNLRLPLQRGEKDVASFLQDHFLKFINELENVLACKDEDKVFDKVIYSDLESKKADVQNLCEKIVNCVELYSDGRLLEAFSSFEAEMDKIQGSLFVSEIRGNRINNRFFRIRPDKVDKRKDLFHIPFDQITKVKAYRYSIAGFPCLYICGGNGGTASLSLCWFECGMPAKFSWSEYAIDDSSGPIFLLDLTISPFTSALNAECEFVSALNHSQDPSFIVKMIATYPLMAACSLIVENKNQNFLPEYIIPQMLLSWARKSKDVSGIAYISCSNAQWAKYYNAFNIVLPPKTAAKNGHCEKLKNEFKLSEPKLVELSKIFSDKKQNFDKVKSYRDKLRNIYVLQFPIKTIAAIISICDSFLEIFEMFLNNKVQDIAFVYQLFDTLSVVSRSLIDEKFNEIINTQLKSMQLGSEDNLHFCQNIYQEFREIELLMNINWYLEVINNVEHAEPIFEFIDQ